ncbi:hypothetical protein DDE01_17770 [Desulfovibrio desulfuricans]|nr:hypothetical protein DDE01_17770 [Desulfovibrio desulfuricans]
MPPPCCRWCDGTARDIRLRRYGKHSAFRRYVEPPNAGRRLARVAEAGGWAMETLLVAGYDAVSLELAVEVAAFQADAFGKAAHVTAALL